MKQRILVFIIMYFVFTFDAFAYMNRLMGTPAVNLYLLDEGTAKIKLGGISLFESFEFNVLEKLDLAFMFGITKPWPFQENTKINKDYITFSSGIVAKLFPFATKKATFYSGENKLILTKDVITKKENPYLLVGAINNYFLNYGNDSSYRDHELIGIMLGAGMDKPLNDRFGAEIEVKLIIHPGPFTDFLLFQIMGGINAYVNFF